MDWKCLVWWLKRACMLRHQTLLIARTAAGVVSKVFCWFWVRSKDGAAQLVELAAFKHFPETAMDWKCPSLVAEARMHAETPSAAHVRTAACVVSKISCWLWVRSKGCAAQTVELGAFKHFPETAMDWKCPVWWLRRACMLRHQAAAHVRTAACVVSKVSC